MANHDNDLKYSQQLTASLKELDTANAALFAVSTSRIESTSYDSKDPVARLNAMLDDVTLKSQQSMAAYAQYHAVTENYEEVHRSTHSPRSSGALSDLPSTVHKGASELLFGNVIEQTNIASQEAINKVAVQAQMMRPLSVPSVSAPVSLPTTSTSSAPKVKPSSVEPSNVEPSSVEPSNVEPHRVPKHAASTSIPPKPTTNGTVNSRLAQLGTVPRPKVSSMEDAN